MSATQIKKWVCIDKNKYIVYIYAPNWESAKKQAEQKGYTLQGEFVAEHD